MCLAVGIASSFITQLNVRAWYVSLVHPPGTPPDWLFGPVWTALYIAMAIAAWLVWRGPQIRRWRALSLWGWQLLLNALWTPLFFGLHLLAAALAVAVLLVAGIALTAVRFRPLDGRAALLLLPYLGWAGYAAYLNAGILWLNR